MVLVTLRGRYEPHPVNPVVASIEVDVSSIAVSMVDRQIDEAAEGGRARPPREVGLRPRACAFTLCVRVVCVCVCACVTDS